MFRFYYISCSSYTCNILEKYKLNIERWVSNKKFPPLHQQELEFISLNPKSFSTELSIIHHYAIIIEWDRDCNNFCYLLLRTHHNWLYVLKRTSTRAVHLKMRIQCIHNIDFDFHYFQFHFIVCKVKHKIENRREKREKNVKKREEEFIFHLTISTLMLPIFLCSLSSSLSFVNVQLKWVQNKMIKKRREREVPTVAIDFKGVQKWDGILLLLGEFFALFWTIALSGNYGRSSN